MRNCNLLKMAAVALILTTPALADVPQLVNFQSILLDNTGAPVADGAYLVKFIIWDDPVAAGGGNEKWNSGFQNITTQNGLFEYHLGSNASLPSDLFAGSDSALFLGITVGVDPEMSPRIKLTSVAFSQHALRSDSSAEASFLGGQTPSYYLDWSNFTSVPAGFADGIDDDTNVGANVPLRITAGNVEVIADGINASHIAASGVGSEEVADNSLTATDLAPGSVGTSEVADNTLTADDLAAGSVGASEVADNSLSADDIAASAVGTSEIADGSIVDADISGAANIAVDKISGTAVSLNSTQTIMGQKSFGDSTIRINNTGIRIGDTEAPSVNYLVRADREYNTTNARYAFYANLDNSSASSLYGYRVILGSNTDPGGLRYGVYSTVMNGNTATSTLYALRGAAGGTSKTEGTSYGVYGSAAADVGGVARGVYGVESGAGANHAGYFLGDVLVSGTVTKGGGAFRIDHPLDPANKYLQHSFVESPDMKNVYDGNAQLDGVGRAIVELPEYFETLNRDFCYQLTPMGSSQPGLYIEQEVIGNRFVIAGGQPNGRVSWQVTGVRKDRWAEANRIQVEVEKTGDERGKYVHYEEYGVSLSQAVDGEELQHALDEANEEYSAEE